MDPKARARIDAGIGGAAFVLALLRARTRSRQGDARCGRRRLATCRRGASLRRAGASEREAARRTPARFATLRVARV
jgi:hypothetical protein